MIDRTNPLLSGLPNGVLPPECDVLSPESREFLMHGASEGAMHGAMFAAACDLAANWQDIDYQTALDLLARAGTICNPPYPEDEIRRCFLDVYRVAIGSKYWNDIDSLVTMKSTAGEDEIIDAGKAVLTAYSTIAVSIQINSELRNYDRVKVSELQSMLRQGGIEIDSDFGDELIDANSAIEYAAQWGQKAFIVLAKLGNRKSMNARDVQAILEGNIE